MRAAKQVKESLYFLGGALDTATVLRASLKSGIEGVSK
jgi:hypothetical protein